MPIEWPTGPGFDEVDADLQPLREAYGEGELFLPDGLEDVADTPPSNGLTRVVPWEYKVTVGDIARAPARLRGVVEERTIVIRGVTLVQGEGEAAVCRRYVDWAAAWAQLGVSSGRGEAGVMRFVDPTGEEVTFPPDES
jgi:hypothetical protein